MSKPRDLLLNMFKAAIAAAQPSLCVPRHLPSPPKGRMIVIGAGKASAAMAKAVEDHWDGPLVGLVVTQYGYSVPCRSIKIVEASHPIPDAAGLKASQQILDLVRGLTPDDTVLCLISGGGSSLLPLPIQGLTLDEKQNINMQLLTCGASVHEINCVRRHMSAIKGGRLAAACYPAKVVTLMISDVPGNDYTSIASGPTVGDPTSCADALAIIDKYQISIPESLRDKLRTGAAESIKPDDPRLENVVMRIISTPQMALEMAAAVAEAQGIPTRIISDRLEGEARVLGRKMALRALKAKSPVVLLSGGETTVTVRGTGRGGRNVEFLLSLGIALGEQKHIYALAADTDGVDGQEAIAGAVLMPDTLDRARARGMDPAAFLENNDAHTFFKTLNDSVITGPTYTNVNDFRAILLTE